MGGAELKLIRAGIATVQPVASVTSTSTPPSIATSPRSVSDVHVLSRAVNLYADESSCISLHAIQRCLTYFNPIECYKRSSVLCCPCMAIAYCITHDFCGNCWCESCGLDNNSQQ